MANMTFGVNLLPNNTGGQKTLGNSNQKWDIYANTINGVVPQLTDTTYTFDGTYNASTNKAATVATVTNAIATLDSVLTGSPAASKTLTVFSQVNGIISATFADITITESQVTNLTTHLNAKAPLASPSLTGTPTAPTAAVNTNTTQIATTAFVTRAINNLGTAAFTNTSDYATAAQGTLATNAMPKSGGTFTGAVTLAANPTTNLGAATKQYVDNNVQIVSNLSSGTEIATINIGGDAIKLYSPGTPSTISVTQSSSTPTLEFITSTNASSSATLTGVTSTTISDGKMIVYRLAYSLPGTSVSLTLSNTSGTSLGNYPVYIDGNNQCTSAYTTGTTLFLVFYSNKWYIINPFGVASA